MGWEEADKGWGARAKDWAYLMESTWWPEFDRVLRDAGVGEGGRHLDVCCGSGLAAQMAAWRGAEVCALDASERLLNIARARTPEADIRHGDMHDLPWGDGVFDTATSFRGIWGPNQQAVDEVARVLRPGGTFGVSFFPMDAPSAWDDWWVAIARVSEHEQAQSAALGSIAESGRVEEMCEAAGLVPGERRLIRFEIEGGPEVEDFVRATLSAGPTWTAINERGQDDVEEATRRLFEPMWDPEVGLRIGTAVEYLVATKPE